MEAEELQLLLKIRQGIINGSWEEVINAWNEISGEQLEVPDTKTPAEKLQDQIQKQLKSDHTDLSYVIKDEEVAIPPKNSGVIDSETMEETLKDEDIVKIEESNDDNSNREKKNTRGVKRRASGIPEDMKASSEKSKGKPARFYDEMPAHIPRGSE